MVEAEVIPSRVCANCDKPAAGPGDPTFRRCGRCKRVWYCSKACQKKHWRKKGGHNETCKQEKTKTAEVVEGKTAAAAAAVEHQGSLR